MNSNDFACPICGGAMHRVKVLPNNMPGMVRFKCTCGHCEDLKADQKATSKQDETFAIEGFQEIP